MGKILYIRLDSSPLPKVSDEIIVKNFNLENYFCSLLGEMLFENVGLSGAKLYSGRLITDFENVDKDAYREIIQQWEEVLSSLLQCYANDKKYEIRFPLSYCQWLDRHECPEYSKINNFLKITKKLVLNSDTVYEIIHSVLIKKLSFFLRKNACEVKTIVFSLENIGEQSYIKHLMGIDKIEITTLRQSCISCPYDDIMTNNTSAILKRGATSKLFIYGKRQLECIYDEVDFIINGYARVRKGNKWGVINDEGVEVIPFIYDVISNFHEEISSRKLMAYARLNNKYGYIDINNDVVIPFDYERICTFEGEYAWAELNGKWGTIDVNNKMRIPFQYDFWLSNFFGLDDYYIIEENSQVGLIKNDGSVFLPCIFKRIYKSGSHNIVLYKGRRQDVASFYKQYGYLRYSRVGSFSNGMAIVERNGKFGFINEYGIEVIGTKYDLQPSDFDEDGFAVVFKYGKYGMIDRSGKEVIPFVYEYISSIGKLKCAKNKGKYGFLNNKGEVMIPFIYDDASNYDRGGVARVVYEGKSMYLDENGETLFCNNSFDCIDDFCNGVAIARKDGKIGLIDKRGNEIWPCNYDCDSYVNRVYLPDFFIVSRKGKYGILNIEGKELIPCILDEVFPFSGQEEGLKRYGVVKRNNKYALIEISENRKNLTVL